MSLFTGDRGKVLIDGAAAADITRWSLKTWAATASYASSATGGGRRHLQGNPQGAGELQFKLNVASPAAAQLTAGAAVVLRLHLDDTHYYQASATIESLAMQVEIDGDAWPAGTAQFCTQGATTAHGW